MGMAWRVAAVDAVAGCMVKNNRVKRRRIAEQNRRAGLLQVTIDTTDPF